MSTRYPRVALPWAATLATIAALSASGCGGSSHVVDSTMSGSAQADGRAGVVTASADGDRHHADPAPVRGSVREPVEIIRDKHGISHIYAKNPRDLF